MDQALDHYEVVRAKEGARPWDRFGRYIVPTLLAFVLTMCLSLVGWAFGLGRADVVNEQQIKITEQQIKAVAKQADQIQNTLDGKVSKEEFSQFVKDLDTRLTLIQSNTELLVRQGRERSIPVGRH